jgi:P27 family predicted phage terminase small subunit
MARARVPLEKREVEGTVRAKHRQKAEGAPQVPVVLIQECPGLSKIGLKYWPNVREVLHALPVTATSDLIAVQRLTETYALVRDLAEQVEKVGRVYNKRTMDGVVPTKHPLVDQLTDAEGRLRLYLNEFGLTPASRTKVKGEGGGDGNKDPLTQFGI